ncbi:MAG: hypothetical protein RBU28_02850 [Bacteroidales bacterium]|jgi:hypothetical protein|nr:hypothetical protein [Bacteroidales bacterium]
MSKVSKSSVLFFIVLLLFLSIKSGNYALGSISLVQSNHTENSDFYFSTGQPDLFFLTRNEERSETSVRNLPAPYSKKHFNDFYFNPVSAEKRIIGLCTEYLLNSIIIQPGLSNVEIIYPFHSHW